MPNYVSDLRNVRHTPAPRTIYRANLARGLKEGGTHLGLEKKAADGTVVAGAGGRRGRGVAWWYVPNSSRVGGVG
jgi:hypothetical protein